MAWLYNYVIGEEQSGSAFSLYGLFAHSLLEKWGKGELELYELLNEYVENYDKEVYVPFPKKMQNAYYNDGYNFFSSFDGLPGYKILGVEDHFQIEFEDFAIQGYIDLEIEHEDGRLIVHDWKSKKEFKTAEEEAKYRRQLYLYSARIKEKYGRFPDGTQFYRFRNQLNPISYRPFDKGEYEEAIEWAHKQVEKIRKLYSNYTYFWCSNICGFNKVCQIKSQVEKNKCWQEIIKRIQKGELYADQ